MTPVSDPSRKSFGAVRFDVPEFSSVSTASPSRRRRSIAVSKAVETNLEENDDEAERLARREQTGSGSPASTPVTSSDRRQSGIGSISSISNVSAAEVSNQIALCIKMNAENKINDKNAFQLKMIDFLVYTLKKHDPKMTNLQMVSASLDASAKIYGFRVDKVHSDLLKIIGAVKQDKRDNANEDDGTEDAGEPGANKNEVQQKKKRKKNRQHIISTSDALKGNVETYDPLSLIRCQRDTQTSDMLFQAGLPQHANQGVALNLYNDVILDKIPTCNSNATLARTSTPLIEDFSNLELCPSYAAFKFIGWSLEDEPEEQENGRQTEDNDGEFHFDLDAAVPDDNVIDNDTMMDCGDAYEERCDRLAQKNQHIENIVDFQDIIANNPNPNANYEYSYLQKSYRIHWVGPSHWKITMNKNLGGSRVIETCKQNAKKKKKEIELEYIGNIKEEAHLKFEQINRHTKILAKSVKTIWADEKITFPQDMHHNHKRFYVYFNKQNEYLKLFDFVENVDQSQSNVGDNFDIHDDHDMSNLVGVDDRDNLVDIPEDFTQDQHVVSPQDGAITQGAFVGDNLVSVPKLTDKIFIPYSQRAKKIDMRQLKKVMWKNLQKKNKETEKENFNITQAVENESTIKDIEPKDFSTMYKEIPKMLSKTNVDSLSSAIAFISLLHLANEKNLKLDRNSELNEVCIKGGKSNG